MSQNDPLHGVTLKMMLEQLHQKYGWDGLSARININCFKKDPSIKSSLTFLRRTPWAREKVERLFLKSNGQKVTATSKPNSKPKPTRAPGAKPTVDPWANAKR